MFVYCLRWTNYIHLLSHLIFHSGETELEFTFYQLQSYGGFTFNGLTLLKTDDITAGNNGIVYPIQIFPKRRIYSNNIYIGRILLRLIYDLTTHAQY